MSATSWRGRTLGASLTLLVQLGFLLMVILTPARPLKHLANLSPETILLLRASPRPSPRTIDARGAKTRRARAPSLTATPALAPTRTPSLAPPSGLAGFGQALFGCAPEHYADLTPDERAHCPKPGEGMARNTDKDLLSEPRSHAKDEAVWQELYAEEHWMPAICAPTGQTVVQCLIDQSIAEHQRAQAAWARIAADKAAALKAASPSIPMPRAYRKAPP